jgi:ferredoxin
MVALLTMRPRTLDLDEERGLREMCTHNGCDYDCSTCYMDATEGKPDTPPPSDAERERRTAEYNANHPGPR